MSKCPQCGAEKTGSETGNTERMINIEVPESQFALMRTVFREMNTKLGMHGFGELANQLRPFHDLFMEDFDTMRYFDDHAVAMAFTGVKWGYKTKVIIGKEGPAVGVSDEPRVKVNIEFTGKDGAIKTLTVADNAIKTAAERFKTYFEDAAERMAPLAS